MKIFIRSLQNCEFKLLQLLKKKKNAGMNIVLRYFEDANDKYLNLNLCRIITVGLYHVSHCWKVITKSAIHHNQNASV